MPPRAGLPTPRLPHPRTPPPPGCGPALLGPGSFSEELPWKPLALFSLLPLLRQVKTLLVAWLAWLSG